MTRSSLINRPGRMATLATVGLGLWLAACGVPRDQHNAVAADLAATQQSLHDVRVQNADLVERSASCEASYGDCVARVANLRTQLAARSNEADRRDAIYQQLVGRLQGMIDSGYLQVHIEHGRIVLVLPNDVLFESGRAALGAGGVTTLTNVAGALTSLRHQRFQVEGHTDNVPISNNRYSNNWDLSTARAVSVVTLLVEQGVDPAYLSAAGFGEYSPASSNVTAADRAQNRRIQIVLLPDLGNVPEAQAGGR